MANTDITTDLLTAGRFNTTTNPRTGAVRVHRSTCKRAKDVGQLHNLNAEKAAIAEPATCCKPSQEDVSRALQAAKRVRRHRAEKAAEEKASTLVAEATARTGQAAPKSVTKRMAALQPPITERKKPVRQAKATPAAPAEGNTSAEFPGAARYWRMLGRNGAMALAAKYEVGVQVDNDGRTVAATGPEAASYIAQLFTLWTEGLAAYKEASSHPLAEGETSYTRRRLFFKAFVEGYAK